MFNDLVLGWWLYDDKSPPPGAVRPRTGKLIFIAPAIEAHWVTPLSRTNSDIQAPSAMFMTAGLHFGFYQNTRLTFAVDVPVAGRQDRLEWLVQLNFGF
jgi:hypothetical protein